MTRKLTLKLGNTKTSLRSATYALTRAGLDEMTAQGIATHELFAAQEIGMEMPSQVYAPRLLGMFGEHILEDAITMVYELKDEFQHPWNPTKGLSFKEIFSILEVILKFEAPEDIVMYPEKVHNITRRVLSLTDCKKDRHQAILDVLGEIESIKDLRGFERAPYLGDFDPDEEDDDED